MLKAAYAVSAAAKPARSDLGAWAPPMRKGVRFPVHVASNSANYYIVLYDTAQRGRPTRAYRGFAGLADKSESVIPTSANFLAGT